MFNYQPPHQAPTIRPGPPPKPPATAADAVGCVSPVALPIPKAVPIAFISLMTAAATAVGLAGLGVYGLSELRGSVNDVLHLDPSGTAMNFSSGYVDQAQVWLASTANALGILFALAYVLVGRAIRKGRGWPRPVGTVLAVFSLPAILLGPVAVVKVLAGIVAVIATWTSSARQYVIRSKAARRGRFPIT